MDSVVAGMGLAGALLCELAVGDQVLVADGRLCASQTALQGLAAVRAREGLRPAMPQILPCPTANAVLLQILAELAPLPVEDWFAFLARDAYERVAERMVDTGHVRAAKSFRLVKRTTVYPPEDINVSGWAQARLATTMRCHREFEVFDIVLIGLCRAVGLDRRVFEGAAPGELEILGRMTAGLRPPLPELLARLDAAVAASAGRRH